MTNTDSDNSREWAAQAYALLKKRQQEQRQELQKQEEQERQKQEEQELQKQEEQERQKQEKEKQKLFDSKENLSETTSTIAESELGEFDDNFTWSAMVLAAQGKTINPNINR